MTAEAGRTFAPLERLANQQAVAGLAVWHKSQFGAMSKRDGRPSTSLMQSLPSTWNTPFDQPARLRSGHGRAATRTISAAVQHRPVDHHSPLSSGCGSVEVPWRRTHTVSRFPMMRC